MSMKLIHFSDTHIIPPPDTLYGLDPRARLEQAIADINARHADSDLCVVTGDLVHWGEPRAYDVFAEIMSRLALRTVLLIGNHDDRQAYRRRFPDALCDANGFVQGVLNTPVGALVFLDTNAGDSHAGRFCDLRQDWLSRTLDACQGLVLLFMHHPPFSVGISSMDAIALTDSAAFAAIVRPHAHHIRHLFLGHVHRPLMGSWLGIPFSLLPSQNHQVALKLEPHGLDIPGCHEPPAYAVALIEHDQVVIHSCAYLDKSPRFSLDAAEIAGRRYALEMRFA